MATRVYVDGSATVLGEAFVPDDTLWDWVNDKALDGYFKLFPEDKTPDLDKAKASGIVFVKPTDDDADRYVQENGLAGLNVNWEVQEVISAFVNGEEV